jgi:polyphenol oxidase
MGAGVVRVAGWKEYPWLRAGFSTRVGGGSTVYGQSVYGLGGVGELNLGWTAEDDAVVVAANRRGFVDEVAGGGSFELVTVRQVHGDVVRVVERGGGLLATADEKAVLEGDGLITREAGLLLGVQTADCVPVLIADTRRRVVGAFHAGWRGTVARIVERGVETMQREFGSRPEDLIAAVGPAIGACCFAVGDEVRREFEGRFDYAAEFFSEESEGKLHIDLWEANRRQLVDAGVRAAAVSVVGECTACARTEDGGRKYFSHRAEKGFTGRMLSVVGIAQGLGVRD